MTTAIPVPPTTNKKSNSTDRKSRRRHSREFALQGIYQWRITGGSIDFIEAQLRETDTFMTADQPYFSDLLHGVLNNTAILQERVQPCLDRPLDELSPVEFAILLISTYELAHHPEIPYRAIINEAIELARSYGSTDGYKYVNGVLDKLAAQLRAIEIAARQPKG